MEAQPLWSLFFLSAWIFLAYLPSIHSGLETPSIQLDSTVFAAIRGDELHITCKLKIPVNESSSMLTCSDPLQKQIYNNVIPATASEPKDFEWTVLLKNMQSSGKYSCKYKKAKVYWFLRLRDHGYKEPTTPDFTECIVVSVLTGVLLIFSVVGSVYVLRGYWEVCCRKKNPIKEAKEEQKMEENSVETIATTPPSFYASLEPRPRSIYDVLDHSTTKTEPAPCKDKPKKNKPPKMVTESKPPQQEDMFESVYENF